MLTSLQNLHPAVASIVLVVGVLMLLLGGHWLVEGAVSIARRLGWSTLLIGLTLVAFGTSAPELAFNVTAALSGNSDLSFGNVVGSNFANVGLILGISALVRPLAVHGRIIRKELPQLMIVSVAMIGLAFVPLRTGGSAGYERNGGLLLLLAFGIFVLFWYRMGLRDSKDPLVRELEAEATAHRPVAGALGLIVVGFAGLALGGKLAESGAVNIARSAGLSQSLIGLTIVAIATSLPELATSIVACRKGHDDLAVGNVVGSNMFNILLVLGTTSAITPVAVPMPWGWWDLGVMTAITFLLLPMAFNYKISRAEGALLLIIYVGYMSWGVVRELF